MSHILLCQGYHKKAVSTYLHCYSVEVLYNYIFYSLESVHAREYSQIYWYACSMSDDDVRICLLFGSFFFFLQKTTYCCTRPPSVCLSSLEIIYFCGKIR